MKKNIYISVIIPSKNEENRIQICLSCIFSMNFDSDRLEVIVVDNGSTDSTVNIAKEFGCTVYVMPELTIAGLRNFGAKKATANIIGFVDADIEVHDNWAKNGVALFNLKSDVACVTGKIKISSNPTWVEKTWGLNRDIKRGQFKVNWISSMNMIIRKDSFLEVGGFNENLITCEDVDLSYRLKEKGFSLLYDDSIEVTHHGEAKSIKELFKKEKWRGTSMIDVILSHGLTKSELPSLLQLFFFLICLSVPLYFAAKNNFVLFFFSIPLILILLSLELLLYFIKKKLVVIC